MYVISLNGDLMAQTHIYITDCNIHSSVIKGGVHYKVKSAFTGRHCRISAVVAH